MTQHARLPPPARSPGKPGVAALDPANHIDGMAGLVQQRSLVVQRLVRPVTVVVPRVLGHDLPEMLLTDDQ